jgi:hypothetical protein
MGSDTERPSNKLIRLLEPAAYERVAPKLKPTTLQPRQILYTPNQPIHAVYFPETAVICQMTVMENGDTLETATTHEFLAMLLGASRRDKNRVSRPGPIMAASKLGEERRC